MVILTSLQTINAGENWVVMEPTDTVSGNGDCQSPRKYCLHMLEKRSSKKLSLEPDIPPSRPASKKTIIRKNTCTQRSLRH